MLESHTFSWKVESETEEQKQIRIDKKRNISMDSLDEIFPSASEVKNVTKAWEKAADMIRNDQQQQKRTGLRDSDGDVAEESDVLKQTFQNFMFRLTGTGEKKSGINSNWSARSNADNDGMAPLQVLGRSAVRHRNLLKPDKKMISPPLGLCVSFFLDNIGGTITGIAITGLPKCNISEEVYNRARSFVGMNLKASINASEKMRGVYPTSKTRSQSSSASFYFSLSQQAQLEQIAKYLIAPAVGIDTTDASMDSSK